MGVVPEHLHGLVARDAHGRASVHVAVLLEQGHRRVAKAVDGETNWQRIAVPVAISRQTYANQAHVLLNSGDFHAQLDTVIHTPRSATSTSWR